MTHPYDEGYSGYDEEIQCPYEEGTEDWENWNMGRDDAMAEDYEEDDRREREEEEYAA